MRVKLLVVYCLSVLLLVCIMFHAEPAIAAAKEALVVCGQTVIPSLFPFFVLSSFMIGTGFVSSLGKLLSPLAKRLFRVSGSGAVVFVVGILCGYPTGAKMVAELYEQNLITKNEANRLLPFCNNSGPLFIIGAVGLGMLGNKQLGFLLYIVHVLSAVFVGVIFSLFSKKEQVSQPHTIVAVQLGRAFSDAVCRGTKTMLEVCGFLVFFSVLRVFLMPIILKLLGESIPGLVLSAMTEVTLGAYDICSSGISESFVMVALSGVVGFGGVCVMLQVMGVVSEVGLGIKTYVCGKLLQMSLSIGMMSLVVRNWEIEQVFSNLSAVPHRYMTVSPFLLIAFFFACAYASAIKKH